MSPFKFSIGQKVICHHPGQGWTGVVFARGRYSEAVSKWDFTPGDRYYLVDCGGNDNVQVAVEAALRELR